MRKMIDILHPPTDRRRWNRWPPGAKRVSPATTSCPPVAVGARLTLVPVPDSDRFRYVQTDIPDGMTCAEWARGGRV